MMGGVSPEACWAIQKHLNNKFYYMVASCWFFLWDLDYDARIHEYQTFRVLLQLVSMCQFPLFQVGAPEIREYSTLPDYRQLSYLFIVTTLQPIHFSNGQLIIKCTAHVSTLYLESTEVHLMSRTREPIPERGKLTKQVNKCTPSANNIVGNISSLFCLH